MTTTTAIPSLAARAAQYQAEAEALVKQAKEDQLTPAGAYNAHARSLAWGRSKAGDPMLTLEAVTEGESQHIFFDRAGLWSSPRGRSMGILALHAFNTAFGLPPGALLAQAQALAAGEMTVEEATAELGDVEAIHFNVEVTHKDKKVTDPATNEVKTETEAQYAYAPYRYIPS